MTEEDLFSGNATGNNRYGRLWARFSARAAISNTYKRVIRVL